MSEIAFGARQVGGDWGPVDDAASADTLLYAFEHGEKGRTWPGSGWLRRSR